MSSAKDLRLLATQFPSREAFEKWLTPQADRVVGIPHDPCRCPLARFLRQRGWQAAKVGSRGVHLGSAFVFVPLPPWAERFVADIDAFSTDRPTGATALAVLAGARGAETPV